MQGLELYEKVRTVPEPAKKKISGGRLSGMTDINPMWRIKTLTEQFGPCGFGWYYKPVKDWIQESDKEKAVFVTIELYINVDGVWSMPIYGTGGSMFAAKERSGIYVSDECYKMATTDAISVACKQLGIGADVYWDKDSTKYDRPEVPEKEPQKPKNEKESNKPAEPEKITQEQLDEIMRELKRTGVTWRKICDRYKVEQLSHIHRCHYDGVMKGLLSTPDKPDTPDKPQEPAVSNVSPEEPEGGLPWNTPVR